RRRRPGGDERRRPRVAHTGLSGIRRSTTPSTSWSTIASMAAASPVVLHPPRTKVVVPPGTVTGAGALRRNPVNEVMFAPQVGAASAHASPIAVRVRIVKSPPCFVVDGGSGGNYVAAESRVKRSTRFGATGSHSGLPAKVGRMTRDATQTIQTPDGPMDVYDVVPDQKATGAVIVIQEAFGVNDYIRDVTRRFAAAGYHAVAPTMFHRAGGGTAPYGDFSKVMPLFRGVSDAGIVADVDATVAHLRQAGFDDARIGIVGFCFGGRGACLVAHRRQLRAALRCLGGCTRTPGHAPSRAADRRPRPPRHALPRPLRRRGRRYPDRRCRAAARDARTRGHGRARDHPLPRGGARIPL